jgi:hypothetical protein
MHRAALLFRYLSMGAGSVNYPPWEDIFQPWLLSGEEQRQVLISVHATIQ